MAKKPDHLADFEADDTGGVLSNLLAEEDELDRRGLWRIGSWGVGATAAVVLAVMANQSSLGLKREQVAATDLTRQAQQIQVVARETQNEARRLSAAIDTLNSDRDRLYSRVTSLEQGLDSVTGAIARQASASASPPVANPEPQAAANPPPSPAVAPVATSPATLPAADKSTAATAEPAPAAVYSAAKDAAKTDAAKAESAKPETAKADLPKVELAKADLTKADLANADLAKADTAKADTVKPEPAKPSPATPLMAAQSMMAPPDPAAGKLIAPGKAPNPVIASPIPDVAAAAPSAADAEADDDTAPKVSLRRTEFGVDLGTANSVNGLRALWLGLLKSRSNAPLTGLRPIIVIKEATGGLGMQLRLVAGPLNDAGAAARICAILTENKRPCETTIFDGQRLSLKSDDPPPTAAKPPLRRRGIAKRAAAVVVEEVAKKPEAPPAPTQTTLSSFFSRKNSQ
ncbi:MULTISPECIES: pentapeptide repeat-containing protein [unclassified Bradyrhizobium]|uniref:pentapeptide repeat-containing protein n=1 Tax=unclassified Bradyrhizobium TaxID=2631580 RepID=UPI002FF047AB